MRKHRDLSEFKKDLSDILEDKVPPSVETELFQELLTNIGQIREEKFDIAELRLLNTAFKELRYALKVFKPYRNIPKAAVFGSARTPKDHAHFKIAEDFGRQCAKKGWMIITGGAAGIMEAAMIGAGAEKSFGLNIMLPFEQSANAIIMGNEKLIFFKYFFTRKLMFLKESAATVLFPGGFGTFDEGFESFTLVQTGKAKPRPLVLVDQPGSDYWKSLMRFIDTHLGGEKLISHGDLKLIRHFQDADKASDELVQFYRNYHSSRFLRDLYLIRLTKKVTDPQLAHITHEFGDMLTDGGFGRLENPAEDDIKDPALERIVFHFDRSSYSRMRLLIDHLNTL